jgi:hypothetical protein
MQWYVCDMDDGVLRVEPSRRAAVEWWKTDQDAPNVIERFTYGPGYYGYLVGPSAEEAASAAIVREDKLAVYGITTPATQIQPLYPYPDRPRDRRDD